MMNGGLDSTGEPAGHFWSTNTKSDILRMAESKRSRSWPKVLARKVYEAASRPTLAPPTPTFGSRWAPSTAKFSHVLTLNGKHCKKRTFAVLLFQTFGINAFSFLFLGVWLFRNRRSLKTKGSGMNSIDAQSVVVSSHYSFNDTLKSPGNSLSESEFNKKPLVINMTPIRTVFKQLGLLSSMPYLDNVMGMMDSMNLRDMLERVRLGSYVDRYQKLYNDYTDEVDVAHCFLEYAVYTIFNHRFALKNSISSSFGSRGFEQDSIGMILHGVTELLQREDSSQLLSALFKMIPSPRRSVPEEEGSPAAVQSAPDVQALATNIARFYLRNYFSTLPGSKVRVDDRDPTNNPESLSDMVEQVSRPVFLSLFGVVPGVPASGRLDHLLLIASKERARPVTSPSNAIGLGNTESRNKLTPLDQPPPPPQWMSAPNGLKHRHKQHFHPAKTGNAFFDLGNAFFGTIQRANDATHGLYCAKQYVVNRMWDQFRGTMRRMMRAIPSAG